MTIVVGVHAPLLEGSRLEQFVKPVAGGHDTFLASGVQFVLAAARAGGDAPFLEVFLEGFG